MFYDFLCVYSDGACRKPDPKSALGDSSIGIVIKTEDGKHILKTHKEKIGKATNNQAEYRAAIKALMLASRLTNNKVKLLSDSQLLTRQLNGVYKVKNENIKILYKKLKEIELSCFREVEYIHIKRELNKEADMLANEALDGIS